MADQTLASMTAATTPLNGAELLYSVQSAADRKVTSAGVLNQSLGAVTVNTPLMNLAQTWNASGVTFQGALINITNTASAAGSKIIDFRVGSISIASVDTVGLNLGVQQNLQGSLILNNTAASAFPTTVKSSNSATAAWTLTLPVTAGSANNFLSTDGTGISSWGPVSLTASVSGILPGANGGTNNGFMQFSGPATSLKTYTLPNSSQSLLCSDLADQTVSGGANVTSASLTTGSVTIDCGKCPLQYITNGGSFTITAPTNDGNCMLLVTNNASAGTITFSGFTVGSNLGDAFTTLNGNKFTISIWRINGVSGYRVAAHQ